MQNSPSAEVPNAGGVGVNCIFQPVKVSGSENLCPSTTLVYVHDSAGGGTCSVNNNFGGSRSWLITVIVQLTSNQQGLLCGSLLMIPTDHSSITCM